MASHAGRPKLRAFRTKMDKFDESGGMEWFLERIADGETMQAIAKEIGCSRGLLYMWLKTDPEKQEQFRQAREMSAHAHAEDALQMADEAMNPVMAPLVRERVQHRRWMAEKFNKQEYGKQNDPAIQINIGELHLEALKAANPMQPILIATKEADDGSES